MGCSFVVVSIFFPLGFLIGVVCFVFMVKLDLFCFVVWVLLYIYIYIIIETIQEVDATDVHEFTL